MATAIKRKKNSRQRATTTHGWGSMKKHRGAGNRGGRGNAGSGKRGDAKKPTFRVKLKRELGRHGFSNAAGRTVFKPVNIYYIENSFETLLAQKYITENKGIYVLDVADIGFNKLLATGKVSRKYEITVGYASEKAIEKIEAAKGKVNVVFEAEDAAETTEADEE